MRFSYWDLLSGVPIYVDGVGTFRSPQLKELHSNGVGFNFYNLYISLMAIDKNGFLEQTSKNRASILNKNPNLSIFQIMAILMPEYREGLRDAFDFFLTERVAWDEENKRFVTVREIVGGETPDIQSGDTSYKIMGTIDEKNFDDVRDMVLQMNYFSLGEDTKPKFANDYVKKCWEREQEYKRKFGKNGGDGWMKIDNMVSKLCLQGNYNFQNVFELTVYQLHDQFFQMQHLRGCSFTENAVATNGVGEKGKFEFQDWAKPVPELFK